MPKKNKENIFVTTAVTYLDSDLSFVDGFKAWFQKELTWQATAEGVRDDERTP